MENKSILDENIGVESSAAENNSNKNLGDKINKKLMAQQSQQQKSGLSRMISMIDYEQNPNLNKKIESD